MSNNEVTVYGQGLFGDLLKASINLSYTALKSIQRWWDGEISGARCVKNIIDSSVAITGMFC